jgi:hypothetical protein
VCLCPLPVLLTPSRHFFELSFVRLLPAFGTTHSAWARFGYCQLELGAALRKPNLLIDPVFGFTPSGAEFEGLIHAARCSTCSLANCRCPPLAGVIGPVDYFLPA